MKDLSSFKKNLSLNGKKIIITGCNSGIGLSLIKKTFSSNKILAFVNEKKDEVKKLLMNDGEIVKCDFSNIENIIKYQELITEFNLVLTLPGWMQKTFIFLLTSSIDKFLEIEFKKAFVVL